MPGLRPRYMQTQGQTGQEEYCCVCEENDCLITLSSRYDMVLFADGEEVVTHGNRCDCIIVLRRNNVIEAYSIELKRISNANQTGALNPDKLRQKWGNCLKWALNIINNFNSVSSRSINIRNYVVLVIPKDVLQNTATLIKRQKHRYKPRIPSAGRIQGRILLCNSSIIDKDKYIKLF